MTLTGRARKPSVVIVDTPAKVDSFVVEIETAVIEGLLTPDDMDVVRYVGRGPQAPPGSA